MTPPPDSLRSKLGQVRGLGSAKEGTHHWWMQRVTAIALVPLTLWFVYSVTKLMALGDQTAVAEWLSAPCPAIAMILFLVTLFWHAKLGMQVIIEDYVHREWMKTALLLLNTYGFFFLGAVSLLAVLKLHFLDIVSGVY